MSAAGELEELIAGWQVEALDEAGLRRLEALLLADEAARARFVTCCREDVALRAVCRVQVDGSEPGEDTRRLMAATGPLPRAATAARRRSGTGTGRTARSSGPNRAPATRRAARRPRRGRSTPAIALAVGGAALALLLVLVVALVQRPGPAPVAAPEPLATPAPVPRVAAEPRVVARLVELGGEAECYREEDVGPAHRGQGLRSGDRVLLKPEATAAIALDDGSRFELAAGADVLVVGGPAGFTLLLASGEAEATVATQAAGQTVAIRTPEGTVTVVGTAFTVEARRVHTRVAVHEGLVRAAAHSRQQLMVGAGEVAIIRDGRVSYERPAMAQPAPPVSAVEPQPEPAAPEPPPVAGGVQSFSLLDADRDIAVGGAFDPVPDGAVIDREALGLGGLSLLANITGPVFAVRFWIDGELSMREQYEPFTLAGDMTDTGDFRAWEPAPGTYLIEAQGYRDFNARDPVGERARLTLTIR